MHHACCVSEKILLLIDSYSHTTIQLKKILSEVLMELLTVRGETMVVSLQVLAVRKKKKIKKSIDHNLI